MVREARMEESLGLGRSAGLRWSLLWGMRDLPLRERSRGRGKGSAKLTFGPDGDQSADKGAWICILVDDVDAVYQHCLAQGIEVTFPPTDMPWHLREMHVRHPDGHVFRIGQHGLEEEDDTANPERVEA